MTYSRPPNMVIAGRGLIQTPPPSALAPAGILPVIVDAKIATASDLGIIQVGNGLSISPSGVLSSTGGSSVGTWSPGLVSSTGGTFTLTTTYARYSKIGQQVTCYFDFIIVTETGGTNAGLLSLTGLPFTSIASTGYVGTLIVPYFELLDDTATVLTGSVPGSSTQALLWDTHQATSSQRMRQENVRPTTRLAGTIMYLSES